MEYGADHQDQQHRRRNECDPSGAQPPETLRQIRYRKPAGNRQGQAPRHIHHAQRRDERMGQPQSGEQETVDRPQSEPGRNRRQGANPGGKPCLHHQRRNHAGQAKHRTHRKIDPRGDDDEQLAQRQQNVDCRLPEDIHQVIDRQEMIRKRGKNRAHAQQPDQGTQASQNPRIRTLQPLPRPSLCCRIRHAILPPLPVLRFAPRSPLPASTAPRSCLDASPECGRPPREFLRFPTRPR